MMNTCRHYWNVYKGFVSTSFTEAMSYRLHFILLILMDLFFYFSVLATVSFIYDHVETIGPWNREQLMFFMSFMLVIDHLHMTLISESFWVLSRDLKSGGLDYIILKPVNTVYNIFFRYIRPASLCNIPVTWGLLIYYGREVGLSASAWAMTPLLILLAFSLMAVIEFIIATLMFWMTEGLGINFLRMQMQQLARWPDYVFSHIARRVLTFGLPILVIGSAPVHFLYDFTRWPYLVGLVVSLIVMIAVLSFVWKKGLLRYESASS